MPFFARATGRLLPVVLLCLALVVSQMAHVQVPSAMDVSSHATMASHPTMPAEASHAHDAEQETGHERHSGGGLDQTCATQCPSVFVQPDGGTAARPFHGGRRHDFGVATLAGTIVPAPERPPRA